MAKSERKSSGKTNSNQRERLPKLDLGALGRDKTAEVKLVEHIMTTDSDYGSSELFHVKVNGEMFSWFIRRRSGNYNELKRRFGRDPVRWEGKTITVVEGEFETEEGRKVPYLMVEGRESD